jgi:hypothetical protein
MKVVRALTLAAALAVSAPLVAQELSESALKAFSAKIDAAISDRDVDTIVQHIADYAVISGTADVQGQTRAFRMDKSQYRKMLTMTLAAAESYEYERTNEKISIEGDQGVITADVTESMVIQGQRFTTKTRERATVRSIDGKLVLTQLVANQIL